ncbi:MAG: AbrB/MazE/SpoVT family DNA-binding domain-containing protein [Hydrogenophilales bacterium]|nr:AbrB/MazE/SpoVT family DNA-binding domain-containing protein [Hydrogenophilales bacterium]
METVKLSSKGQIVIPKEVRETHRLAIGMEFTVEFVGDEIRLKPLPIFLPSTVAQSAGLLAKAKRKRKSDQETDFAIGDLLKTSDEATKK